MNKDVQQLDIVFEDITVVTTNEQGEMQVLPHHYVVVADGKIKAVEGKRDLLLDMISDRSLSYSGEGRVLMPSFANTHGHLSMSLLRNSADDLPLHEWLFDNIFPREEKLTAEAVRAGSELAMLEMIQGGTTCAADMYFIAEETAKAALDAGFRLNLCCEGKGVDSSGNSVVRAKEAEQFVQTFNGAGNGLLNVSLLVHSVYLYEEHIYRQLSDLAKELGIGIQVHVSETEKEVQDCLERYGLRPAEKLAAEGIFDVSAVAAHCVWLNESERSVLQNYKVSVAHNPTSNLKLGSGVADVPAMLRAGLNVTLGTDGAASNNRLDMYQEMRLAALLPKGVQRNPAILRAADVLTMATENGYKGLGFSNLGRIAPGMEADLQVIRLADINNLPTTEDDAVLSALVYSAGPENVESVVCQGRYLLYKNDFVTIDEEKVRHEAKKIAQILK